MSKKKTRKPAQAKVEPVKPSWVGPYREFPQEAFGTHRGEMMRVNTPAWSQAQAFWDVWAASAQMVALSRYNPLQPERIGEQIEKLMSHEEDEQKRADLKVLTSARAGTCARMIPALSQAQLIMVPSQRVQQLQPWQEITEAYDYALQAELASPFMYLDMMDRDGFGVIQTQEHGLMVLSGALVVRDPVANTLLICVFGGPTDPTIFGTGGPFQPLATIMYGRHEDRPEALNELEVFIDCNTGSVLLSEETQHNDLLGTVCGVAAAGASQTLRLLQQLESETIRPVPRDPRQRKALQKQGYRIPWKVMPAKANADAASE